MTKPTPKAADASTSTTLRQRAAQARDAAGRFIRRARETAALLSPPPTLGRVPCPPCAHPGTYGLSINENGLGLHAPPGASVLVEPVMPEGAGLAVFHSAQAHGPAIFDLPHTFNPDYARPFAPGSTVMPAVEVVDPVTGRPGRIRTDRFDAIHRVIGIYVPADVGLDHRRAPPPLPLMTACPEGMGEHRVADASAYPLVRPGETVVYDPGRREPTHGALCVLQWSGGGRSVLLTSKRPVGDSGDDSWCVDPVNRPGSRAMMERRLAAGTIGTLYASDGPYTEALLREKIVGTVVGVLVPQRAVDAARADRADPMPPPERPSPDEVRDDSERARATAQADALNDADLLCPVTPKVRAAIVRHGEVMEATREPAQDNDEFDRQADQQIAAEAAVANTPARSLADVRAKLAYLIPIIEPDLLDRMHADHLRAIQADVDRLCRGAADLSTVPTAELAAMPFEPLDRASPCPVPTRADWLRDADTILPWLRLGFVQLTLDRDQLADLLLDEDDDAHQGMNENLGIAARNFGQLARFTRAVLDRRMIGMAVVAQHVGAED